MVHVLIAEDDAAVAQVLQRALEGVGHRVTRAADGRTALDAVRLGQPDIVLLDVQMPLLQGIDVVRAVRAIDAAVPIIMMTGSAEPDFDFAACHAAGASAALIKPFRIQVLMAAIRAVMEGRPVAPGDGVLTPGT
ncbi:response regulator transcription factor [Zavarzinia sp. CC-PAN008]|uniref:response regulator transcription factor n=1 Tax=Zavarzinia sp. CC-PAN008 TaxID=3243332 RepID=UPI003F747F4F